MRLCFVYQSILDLESESECFKSIVSNKCYYSASYVHSTLIVLDLFSVMYQQTYVKT